LLLLWIFESVGVVLKEFETEESVVATFGDNSGFRCVEKAKLFMHLRRIQIEIRCCAQTQVIATCTGMR